MNSQLIVATKADLPLTYRHACMAIAECIRIDECKGWMDKSAAIAAYAKMSKNSALEVDAKRIRLRAARRLGELIDPFVGKGRHSRIASENGVPLSIPLKRTARAIARIPEKIFEKEINGNKPPGLRVMSCLGTEDPKKSLKTLLKVMAIGSKKSPEIKARQKLELLRNHMLLDFVINGRAVRDLDWAEVTDYAHKQMHRCRALMMLSEGKNPSLRVGDSVDEAMADEAMRLTENS